MDYLGFSLWEVSNLWQKQLLKRFTEINITHVQFLILKAVYELEVNHEEKTQVRIATQARTDVMMTSKVIRTLIVKGYLERTQHAIDKRAFKINITKTGKKSLRKGMDIMTDFEKKFFKSVESPKKLKKELAKISKRARK
jgi:DNA-binding MarR family transcriptional regulator